MTDSLRLLRLMRLMRLMRLIRTLRASALALLVLAIGASPSGAQTLTFDDVSTNSSGLNNNFTSYNGFNFFGWNVATASALGSGTNAVSATKFALGREGLSSIYRAGPAFNFFDAWLSYRQFDVTSPDNGPIAITVLGYRAGFEAPVFTQFVTLTGAAQRFQFDFKEIEEVVFETDALTAGTRSSALAMDDARLAVVPEPGTVLLVALGGILLLVAGVKRRGA